MARLGWAAFGFGTLNAVVFVGAVVREDARDLLADMPHALAAFWVLSILGAHWSLQGVDLARAAPGEAWRLVLRGGVAGVLVGVGTALTMLLLFPFALAIAAILGLACGLAFAALDVVVLWILRALWNA